MRAASQTRSTRCKRRGNRSAAALTVPGTSVAQDACTGRRPDQRRHAHPGRLFARLGHGLHAGVGAGDLSHGAILPGLVAHQEVDAAAAGDFHRLAHPADIVRALHGHADRLRHLLPLRGQLAEVAAAISVPAAQRCTVNAWRKSRGGTRFVASYRCWYSRAPGRQRSPPAPFTQYLSSPPKMRESIGVVVGRSTMLAHAGSCRSCRVAEQQPKE